MSLLNDNLIAVLRLHHKDLMEERPLHAKPFRDKDSFQTRGGLLFVTETGAPLHGADLLQHFRRWAKKAGILQIRFHDLRHTAAT